jgi:hypothetical protein
MKGMTAPSSTATASFTTCRRASPAVRIIRILTRPPAIFVHYKWIFNDDDKFLGATDFNKIHQPGNFAGDDASLQREQLANTFLRALGVPWLNRRYVAVYVNGNRRGTLMEDAQTPDSDDVKEHFPNDR